MQRSRLRVMLASEHPEVRRLLTEVVEKEPGAVVVGQAENAIKTVALASSLRPEVVLIDSLLPHVVGTDGVRLSRTGGLDAAMGVSEGLPTVVVLVLSDVNAAFRQENGSNGSTELCVYGETGAPAIQLRLHELSRALTQASGLLFAELRPRTPQSARKKVIETSEKAMLYSALAVLGGLGLMFTLILAASGAALALAGASGFLLSLAVRMAAIWWPKSHSVGRDQGWVEAKKLRAGGKNGEASLKEMPRL